MKTNRDRCNCFLVPVWLVVLGAASAGCNTTAVSSKDFESPDYKRQLSTIRVYLEAGPTAGASAQEAPIFRASPTIVKVERMELFSEANVKDASVVDVDTGFVIRLELNQRGQWVIENATASNIGKRLAVVCDFGETRWLAAPVISRRISDGVFMFTPDATREEAERIARGLNNNAARVEKESRFW
jgi:preprotein translocase subunit SecD